MNPCVAIILLLSTPLSVLIECVCVLQKCIEAVGSFHSQSFNSYVPIAIAQCACNTGDSSFTFTVLMKFPI